MFKKVIGLAIYILVLILGGLLFLIKRSGSFLIIEVGWFVGC